VVLWSLAAPLGALVFADRRQAVRWFIEFIALLLCGFVVSEFANPNPGLPSEVIAVFFVLNIGGVSMVAFVLLYQFVTENTRAYAVQKDAFQRLYTLQDRLIQQEKMASLGLLTAGIAHEFKNPLNFINNFSQLSVELVEELREELSGNKNRTPVEIISSVECLLNDLKHNARKINQHGQRADGIVRSMMQHASGASTAEWQCRAVNGLLEEQLTQAVAVLNEQHPDFDVTIERALSSSVPDIDMMSNELGRVFRELLGNALDAIWERAEAEGTGYAPRIAVSTRRVDGQVEIRIEDNGSGIPDSLLERIFEPFFSTKPTGSGTGLGLSISYDVVTLGHGGALTVQSESGRGATFTIVLPETRGE
jgi:signal transduction histidine kinase